jgi:uncharacterized membrane protein (UPF0127 family)
MIFGRLTDANDNCVIKNVYKTTNFFERMLGLLAREKLKTDEGLLITPCSSVHTFGMRYTIDVIFLDKELTIIKIVKSLKPWRMAASNASCTVLELVDNTIEKLQLTTGQKLEWHDEPEN